MGSSSLARVVMASLGVAVVITLGCGKSSTAPSDSFSVQSIFPRQGSTLGTAFVRIAGTGFRSGATVTVDGSRVDATVVDANTITVAMPAHAAGRVDVTVNGRINQAQASVPGGYTYAVILPPVISELLPNIGSTGGSVPITIRGTGFQNGLTVTVGGIKTNNNYSGDSTIAKIFAPAHAAGTVEVIVTNPDGGQAGRGFTYASPATFDFNGDWQGEAQDWDAEILAPVALTIRDNIVVSVSCGASSLTLDPPPVVANGAFSFAGSGGASITGKILSPNSTSGTINLGSCVSFFWSAEKK